MKNCIRTYRCVTEVHCCQQKLTHRKSVYVNKVKNIHIPQMKYLVFVSLAGSSLLGVKKDTMCEPLCDQLHGKRRFLSRSATVLLQQ